ncbi:uncharacterized protein LOC119983942 isoform X1 [Tripterygium wilfordii]|uniref:uncharacterized protein LOC119983942 isoform X1 n=1 Tax=Tripterygium wilfordii TaxID=458696 RepID=UPI0018F82801|nr:uncharacterized protein LOC119983942 isoform X1 [Tripterygium wilfordii]
MANSWCYPDIYLWLQNLPIITQWNSNSMSICICSSSNPPLNLSVNKNVQSSSTISFSIVADFTVPIFLWSSKPIKIDTKSLKLLENYSISSLLINIIEDVLSYSSKTCTSLPRIPKLDSISNFGDVFNQAFLTLTFLICTYEAPESIRVACLNNIKNQLTNCQLRGASKSLMKYLGSNIEEKWMRSLNLAITNWIVELKATNQTPRSSSAMFSYAVSRLGLWKVQLYCPVMAMDIESSSSSADDRLLFSLKYHQLEGVIQLNHKVTVHETWIDVMVKIDNIRCDVIELVNRTLMAERGVGVEEKHFPSRISLRLTPVLQSNIFSVSVSKSSDNPRREVGTEKSIEASFDPPNTYIGFNVSAGETMTMSLKPWKFEESVNGYSGMLNWFLHDSVDGREVFSTKPSKMSLRNPKAWFKDRYSSAYRPFTRQGGVVFAGDEYGERVHWKVDKSVIGMKMEWEIKGWIWLTYLPNKYRTFYNETRKLEFKEILYLTIA